MTAAGEIRSFVERIERIEGEIKEFNDDKRDVYAEAKSSGFDIPALKVVIARRRKDPSKLTEHESLVETYEAALGTPVATRVHAQELAAQAGDDLAIPAFLDRRQA
jgi:uncharacterized protein (UPF0335 family)